MNQNSTPQNLTPKDVAPHIYKWSRQELEEMQAMIAGQLHSIRQSNQSEGNWRQPMPEAGHKAPGEWNPF